MSLQDSFFSAGRSDSSSRHGFHLKAGDNKLREIIQRKGKHMGKNMFWCLCWLNLIFKGFNTFKEAQLVIVKTDMYSRYWAGISCLISGYLSGLFLILVWLYLHSLVSVPVRLIGFPVLISCSLLVYVLVFNWKMLSIFWPFHFLWPDTGLRWRPFHRVLLLSPLSAGISVLLIDW